MSINLNQSPFSGPGNAVFIDNFFYEKLKFSTSYLTLILDKFFGCEYCPLQFQTRQDRIQHTATHFQSKMCMTYHKLLLCINDDWYELHASPCCNTNDKKPNDSSEFHPTNEVKTEEFAFVSDTRQAFKSEANDYGSSDEIDRDNSAFDLISVLEPHIEMKPIPQIVQSLAKLKKNLTISRTRAKKSSTARGQGDAPVKVRRRNKTPATTKRNKSVSNKSSFLDHRPQGKNSTSENAILF